MSISEEDKILQNLLNTILLVAMEDGEITDDELAILRQVKLDVKDLRYKIEKAEEEILTNTKEYMLLEEFKKNLLQNAYDISRSDKKISKDERNLINSLIKILIE